MLELILQVAIEHKEWNSAVFVLDSLAGEYLEGDMKRSQVTFMKYWPSLPDEAKELFHKTTVFGENWSRRTL